MRDVGIKREALASVLNVSSREISGGRGGKYQLADQEFLVVTEEEATDMVADIIVDSLWELPSALLMTHCKSGTTHETLRAMCEDGNSGLKFLIQDIDAVVQGALDLNGRAFYLSYDGEETEEGPYYIYRLN